VCKSEEIVGGDIDITEGTATQEMSYNGCDLEWTDEYTLTSISCQRPEYQK
jgi:hypothetical protein